MGETWCPPPSYELQFENYVIIVNVYRSDTVGGAGGGLCGWLKGSLVDLVASAQGFDTKDGMQAASIRFKNGTHVLALYRSPNQDLQACNKAQIFINDIITEETIIVGDLNIPCNWSSFAATSKKNQYQPIVTMLESKGFSQLVQPATHISGSTLDVILTNVPQVVSQVEVHNEIDVSDHYPVSFVISGDFLCQNKIEKFVMHAKLDQEAYLEKLSHVDWPSLNLSDPDKAMEFFSSQVIKAYEACVPVKLVDMSVEAPPFMPVTMKQIQICRSLKRRKLRRRLREERKKLKRLLNIEKARRMRRLCEFLKQDRQNVYKTFGKKAKKKPELTCIRRPDGTVTDQPQEVADILAASFAKAYGDPWPIDIEPWDSVDATMTEIDFSQMSILVALSETKNTHGVGPDGISNFMLKKGAPVLVPILELLYKAWFQTGRRPSIFGVSDIIAIPKKGADTCDPKGNRPINKCSNVCKNMQRVAVKQVMSHLESKGFFSDLQFGFRHGKSTLGNLLHLVDLFSYDLANFGAADLVFFDFAKAFDSVQHAVLLVKCQRAGLGGRLGRYIESWLANRSHRVKIRGAMSKSHPVRTGTIQGSCWGPLLFLIMIQDLIEVVRGHDEAGPRPLLFADDMKLEIGVKDLTSVLVMQRAIDRALAWSQANDLSFNVSKCQVLHMGSKNPRAAYMMGSSLLPAVTQTSDLGVIMQEAGTFDEQLKRVENNVKNAARCLRKQVRLASWATRVHIWTSFVRPHCEYASAVWSPPDHTELEGVDMAYKIFFAGLRPPVEAHKSLPVPPSLRILYFDLIAFYKVEHNLTTINPAIRVSKTTHNYPTKSSRNENLHPVSKMTSSNILQKRLPLWNSIPPQFRALNLNLFSQYLTEQFLPSLPGSQLMLELRRGKLTYRSSLQSFIAQRAKKK